MKRYFHTPRSALGSEAFLENKVTMLTQAERAQHPGSVYFLTSFPEMADPF